MYSDHQMRSVYLAISGAKSVADMIDRFVNFAKRRPVELAKTDVEIFLRVLAHSGDHAAVGLLMHPGHALRLFVRGRMDGDDPMAEALKRWVGLMERLGYAPGGPEMAAGESAR